MYVIYCNYISPDPHIPPVASAGHDLNITLPQSAVVLDGTGSRDDFGIVSYQWTRSKDSPAAGVSSVCVCLGGGGRINIPLAMEFYQCCFGAC